MIKLANPFNYPIAMLIAGITLVSGVRFLGLPNALMLPTAAVVATAGASVLKSRQPDPDKLRRQALQAELNKVKTLAQNVADKAEILRQEAEQVLTRGDFQVDLLVAVQSVCDRLSLLPSKIVEMSQKVSDKDSLLSRDELESNLTEARQKLPHSSGVAKEHLQELIKSLEKNIELSQTGQDARQAQIFNLYKLVQDSAGVLQEFQNKLRTSNLEKNESLEELKNLSSELNQYQENLDILIG
jgi:uncharacterized protein YllA (UPF0747 family)